MTRKALIISNPGEKGDENYCEGVNVDVSNYKQLLTSPLGGLWLSAEITHLDRPKTNHVIKEIAYLANIDYTFIVFCGHGYFSTKSDTTVLELQKYEELNSLELRANANKRTIILDCCRKVVKEAILEKAFAAKAERMIPHLKPDECRRYFDSQIGKCSKGIVVGYACKKDEVAGDSQSRGGYYSYGILQSAINWHDNINNIDLEKSFYHFSIVKAHEEGIVRVRQLSGGTQNPEIEKPRSDPYFPLAIIA